MEIERKFINFVEIGGNMQYVSLPPGMDAPEQKVERLMAEKGF